VKEILMKGRNSTSKNYLALGKLALALNSNIEIA